MKRFEILNFNQYVAKSDFTNLYLLQLKNITIQLLGFLNQLVRVRNKHYFLEILLGIYIIKILFKI